jgi:pimeloyl-ACP methyl ester carboxylesterase
MNTNSLPDGEVDRRRFPSFNLLIKFLVYDAYFLAFRSGMFLLRHSFPLGLLLAALNPRYTGKDKHDFMAPYQRQEDFGGVVAFPLMVPVRPWDRYVEDFRQARIFLATEWTKPTLVMYSDSSVVPFLQTGDFVVGNRQGFYKRLIPHAQVAPRIRGGHVIQYDNPGAVAHYMLQFLHE